MDTSKEYIEMCEAASEIQELWEPSRADFVVGAFVGYIKDVSIVPNVISYAINPLDEDAEQGKYAWYFQRELIWLPRQDQLQAIWLEGEAVIPSGLLKVFYDFVVTNRNNVFALTSMEQLWLLFVMKEKYNKKWNGEEWVNQE